MFKPGNKTYTIFLYFTLLLIFSIGLSCKNTEKSKPVEKISTVSSISMDSTSVALWNGFSPDYWTNNSKAVYLSEMNKCQPSAALTPRSKHGCWKTIPYETTDGLTGTMIWASSETDAPEVKLPLPVKGWHAIFVGIFYAVNTESTV